MTDTRKMYPGTLLRKYVRTKEDWYPTFEPLHNPSNPNFANPRRYPCFRVDLIRFSDNKGYKVLATGADDFGLEKEFADVYDATRCYDFINQYTTQHVLRARGFQSA